MAATWHQKWNGFVQKSWFEALPSQSAKWRRLGGSWRVESFSEGRGSRGDYRQHFSDCFFRTGLITSVQALVCTIMPKLYTLFSWGKQNKVSPIFSCQLFQDITRGSRRLNVERMAWWLIFFIYSYWNMPLSNCTRTKHSRKPWSD